ncbi:MULTISPECIES: hypothetical protein [unclassified Kribbella]|uniref:hypothetical protein n=1 Tax=unclassified Kribbella TaxID=2644121 RepID=UPI0033E15823
MTGDPPGPAVRAQLLATEHWSLLATRSQTWSEVMGRISAQFTFASASLVVLALTLQVSGLNSSFRLLAAWLGVSVLVTGSLTALRVRNASQQDLMLVIGMNRLRAAYLELDPGIQEHLVTGWTDDPAGIDRTYDMGVRRSGVSHFLASAFVFAGAVNIIVAAGLGAVLADTAGTNGAVTAVVGALSALAYAVLVFVPAHRAYRRVVAELPAAAE